MVHISLYENAFDSILHGIDHLEVARECIEEKEASKNYKQALLSLFQGVELLLKQLLYLKNPIYVFDKNSLYKKCKDPLNPTLDELFECKSLDVNDLCREVKKYYKEFTNLKIIGKLSKERNKIQHFAIKFEKNKLEEELIKLNEQVITPSFRIIGEKIACLEADNDYKYELHMKIDRIFSFWDVADKEEKFLNVGNKSFYNRGGCPKCGNYSLFIFFKDGSYPTSFYCTSCDHAEKEIGIEEFYKCPECGWMSLKYSEELLGGICLCNDCTYSKEAEIVDMEYCNTCNKYKIEGVCECTPNN